MTAVFEPQNSTDVHLIKKTASEPPGRDPFGGSATCHPSSRAPIPPLAPHSGDQVDMTAVSEPQNSTDVHLIKKTASEPPATGQQPAATGHAPAALHETP
jgi:hypothetical protein